MKKVDNHPVLLFDGMCNLCNGWVNFIIDRDPHTRIRFAPLQSTAAQRLLDEHGLAAGDMDTVVFLDDGKVYERSDAVLRLTRYLKGAVLLLRVGVMIPRIIRDGLYDWIARNRYFWFGKRDRCRLPEPGVRDRFLEMSDQV